MVMIENIDDQGLRLALAKKKFPPSRFEGSIPLRRHPTNDIHFEMNGLSIED